MSSEEHLRVEIEKLKKIIKGQNKDISELKISAVRNKKTLGKGVSDLRAQLKFLNETEVSKMLESQISDAEKMRRMMIGLMTAQENVRELTLAFPGHSQQILALLDEPYDWWYDRRHATMKDVMEEVLSRKTAA